MIKCVPARFSPNSNTRPGSVRFGANIFPVIGSQTLTIPSREPEKNDRLSNRVGGNHVAFRAASRKAVRAFHRAALKAGGKDNGKPGLRPQYHANYYGAFAFDPDGNKIEAVTFPG